MIDSCQIQGWKSCTPYTVSPPKAEAQTIRLSIYEWSSDRVWIVYRGQPHECYVTACTSKGTKSNIMRNVQINVPEVMTHSFAISAEIKHISFRTLTYKSVASLWIRKFPVSTSHPHLTREKNNVVISSISIQWVLYQAYDMKAVSPLVHTTSFAIASKLGRDT